MTEHENKVQESRNGVVGPGYELRASITITRATGRLEHYDVTGTTTSNEASKDGIDTLNSGS
jgi:hypothetical protein